MEHVKRVVVASVAVVILGAGLSLLGEVRAASSVEGGKQALPSRKDVVGSWLSPTTFRRSAPRFRFCSRSATRAS